MAIQGMVTKAGIKSCLVVVPTVTLKAQWEAELAKHKIKFAEVLVINTAIKQPRNYDMLVLDECHRYAAGDAIWDKAEMIDVKYYKSDTDPRYIQTFKMDGYKFVIYTNGRGSAITTIPLSKTEIKK